MAGSFGDILKTARRRRGLSQNDLALRSGVSARAIGSLETGTRRAPYRSTVERLSAAMGLTPDERDRFATAAVSARREARHRDGRDAEIERVEDVFRLLRRHRLVTLTGPASAAKERIAAAVVARFECGDPRATVTIDCTPETTIDRLGACIAQAAVPGGLRPAGVSGLLRVMAYRRMLVVLRNAERAMPALAPLLSAIVAGAPGVVFLALSSQRLVLSFEGVHEIAPTVKPAV